MNTLPNNWQPPSITNILLPKQSQKSVKQVMQQAVTDKVNLAVDEELTRQAMEGVARLDQIRVMRASSDAANMLMYELESSFALRSARKIANRNSPLGDF